MDPYLESPDYWSSFHSRLIVGMADAIVAVLPEDYYVEVETRTYLSQTDDPILIGIPDAAVLSTSSHPPSPTTEATDAPHPSTTAILPPPQQVTLPILETNKERYLEIREVASDRVITVIEVLSPKNKRSGEGRTLYETKRTTILTSSSHLVEIDLLRVGTPMKLHGQRPRAVYSVLVSRSHQRPIADFYGFGLQDPLPRFLLPLKSGDPEPIIDIQAIFNGIYDRARYRTRIDYTQSPPPPPWPEADQHWLQQLQKHSETP
jgi:hypothetical protein